MDICPICKAHTLNFVITINDTEGYPKEEIYQCVNCGYSITDPVT